MLANENALNQFEFHAFWKHEHKNMFTKIYSERDNTWCNTQKFEDLLATFYYTWHFCHKLLWTDLVQKVFSMRFILQNEYPAFDEITPEFYSERNPEGIYFDRLLALPEWGWGGASGESWAGTQDVICLDYPAKTFTEWNIWSERKQR